MSCGLVIIGTDTKINKKLLKSGRGFLVKPELESVIQGIKDAINSDRKFISKMNRKYVITNYNWLDKCKELLEGIK